MDIALLAFDGITVLDAVGPYEVLSKVPGAEVRVVGLARGEVRTEEGSFGLVVDAELEEAPAPDVVVVPGGRGTRRLLEHERLLGWLHAVHATSTWTTSVCTGSLLLAAAGLLDGVEAATHWGATDLLASLGAVPVERRVVLHPERRLATAAGVSSGIDLALVLAEQLTDPITAQAIQLQIEYDPEPPFDAGSLRTAPPEVVARASELFGARPPQR